MEDSLSALQGKVDTLVAAMTRIIEVADEDKRQHARSLLSYFEGIVKSTESLVASFVEHRDKRVEEELGHEKQSLAKEAQKLESGKRELSEKEQALSGERQRLVEKSQALERDREALITAQQAAQELSEASKRKKTEYDTKIHELLVADKKRIDEAHQAGMKVATDLADALAKLRIAEGAKKSSDDEASALRSKVQELTHTAEEKSNAALEASAKLEQANRGIAGLGERLSQEAGDHGQTKRSLCERDETIAQKEATIAELNSSLAASRTDHAAALESSNQTWLAKNLELEAEVAKLKEWRSSSRLVLYPPQKRPRFDDDEEEGGEAGFGEERSWEREVREIVVGLLTYRPVVWGGSSMTPTEMVKARKEIVEDMFGTVVEEEPREFLDEFKADSDPEWWYCFERVARNGFLDSLSPVGDDGRCQVHPSCLLIQRAPPEAGMNAIVCKKMPSRH